MYEQGSLVELVDQQPATWCIVGTIPAGSAFEVWQWTLAQNFKPPSLQPQFVILCMIHTDKCIYIHSCTDTPYVHYELYISQTVQTQTLHTVCTILTDQYIYIHICIDRHGIHDIYSMYRYKQCMQYA